MPPPHEPLHPDHLEKFADLCGGFPPTYQGITFPSEENLEVGIAVLDDCPSINITAFVATLRDRDPARQGRTHLITGARYGRDLALCLGAFIAVEFLNNHRPDIGYAFADVFRYKDQGSDMTDAVIMEPFPFKNIAALPGRVLYLMPITPAERRILEKEGMDAFEDHLVATGRDVFDLERRQA